MQLQTPLWAILRRTRSKMGGFDPTFFMAQFHLPYHLFYCSRFLLEGLLLFVFLLTVNLLHRTCFTMVSVPYSSLTARITDDSERTKLTTARMIGASFGIFQFQLWAFQLFYGLGALMRPLASSFLE